MALHDHQGEVTALKSETAAENRNDRRSAAAFMSGKSHYTGSQPHLGSSPLPPIRRVISSMRSMGKGGLVSGFMAMDMSFIGLSSAATRLEESHPQMRQRWMMAHSPCLRTQTATGSICPPQSASRSPGSMSRCRLTRQLGQWLR